MTILDFEQMRKDAEAQAEMQKPKMNLDELIKLGERIELIDQEIDSYNSVLGRLSDQRKDVVSQLVAGMVDLNITDVGLASGSKIVRKEVVTASISEQHKPEAHKWLRENNFGDLIKNEVTVVFGREEDEFARMMIEELVQAQREGEIKFGEIKQKEAVHSSTLRTFVRDQLASGTNIPVEPFGVYVMQQAEVIKPKPKKY